MLMIINKLKNHSGLLILVLIISLIHIYLIKDFKTLNSPLYGGDIYYHFSEIQHVFYGGSIFKSSQFLDEYAHYPWFFYLLVAYSAKLIGISTLKATIFSPVFINLLGGIIVYLLGLKLFNENKIFSLLFSFFWMTNIIPAPVPSNFTFIVLVPLFVLITTFFREFKYSIISGIILGLIGLGHVSIFAGMLLFILIYTAHEIILNKKDFKDKLIFFLPIILIGILIALLFWAPYFLVYKGRTPNRWAEYVAGGEYISVKNIFDFVIDLVFNSNSILLFLLSILSLIALLVMFKRQKSKFSSILILSIATFLGFIHPIITLPLFNTSIGSYGFDYIKFFLKVILPLSGAYIIYKSISNNYLRYAFLFGLSILIISNGVNSFVNFKNDIWVKSALNDDLKVKLHDFASIVINETDVNDVILTNHEETGFAINALTGRKVLIARRTHASPFVDVNQRDADAAVILYGNNITLIKKLINQYKIKYFYEDIYSESAKINCLNFWSTLNSNGELSYDCLRTNMTYLNYLEDNGISTSQVFARLDPASSVAPRFKLLAIKPTNYSDFILKNTKLINQMDNNGVVIARFYKIKNEK